MMTDRTCERCGAEVIAQRPPHSRMQPKRFCSPRCQKAAEKQRWLTRRRAALKEMTNAPA